MNKGSSSRVCFSLTPLKTGHASISLGERFVWDVGRMVRNRERLECEWSGPEYAPAYGKALLWLFPWTSDEQLPIENFDPWFIEVCRRIRLTQVGDGLVAMTRTNTVNRTTGANLQGVTKDFWAPVNTVEVKSLTLSQSDFSFRNLEEFLLSPDWQLPLSVDIEGKDELQAKNWLFLAEAFARGNDKTYGFRRRELIMPAVIIGMASDQTGRTELSDHSKSLINDISVFSDAIEESIGLYIRGGVRLGDLPKENRKKAREKAQKAAKPCQARLDAEADRIFFDHLWKRASARREDRVRGDAEWSETAKAEREFRDALLTIARELLEEALDSLPCPAAYRYRARAKAEGRFIGSVYSHYPELKKVTEEAAEDAA
jgi:CRISPR system Cascade subunit CasA